MTVSSIGIVTGTVASMAIWGIPVDPVSLIYVLMVIGATADYLCHSIYVFTTVETKFKTKDANSERYEKSCRLLAVVFTETMPAAIGTTMAILPTMTCGNNIIRSFFKIAIFAIFVAFFFICFVLPTVFCHFGPLGRKTISSNQRPKKGFQVKQLTKTNHLNIKRWLNDDERRQKKLVV